jgi:hypothetical protein
MQAFFFCVIARDINPPAAHESIPCHQPAVAHLSEPWDTSISCSKPCRAWKIEGELSLQALREDAGR